MKKKTIPFNFSDKHINYIRGCKENMYNIAEGAVRAGKTVDNIFAFAMELMMVPDRIHLATGSTVANAKLNIGDANGFGLEYIFRGQCRWSKYKDNEALIIKGPHTNFKEKIVIFAGGAKADSYKKIRGNSYGMWIATEINLHHDNTIKEAFNRTAAAKVRKFFWDLNPSHPKHKIYVDYIDRYRDMGDELLGGYNYEHFTIDDNINLPKERILEIKSQYDPNTVWYHRDILGRRMVAEGLIYRNFANDPKKYILEKISEPLIIQIGLDFGGSGSKHAFVASGISRDLKRLYALASRRTEPEDPETLYRDYLEFERFVSMKYGPIAACHVDSAEQVLRRGIQTKTVIPIKNSIKNEINDRIRVTDQLMNSGRFYMTKDCESLSEALSMAVWDPDKPTDFIRLDDGTSDIDTLDAFEYSWEKYIKALNVL